MLKIVKRFYMLGILLIVLIFIALTIQYTYLNKNIIKNKERNIEISRQFIGEEINNELERHASVVKAISRYVLDYDFSDDEITESLQKELNAYPTFNSIHFDDAKGKLITVVDWEAPEDYDFRTREWHKKAIEVGELVYSDVYVDAFTHNIALTISNPIYNDKDEIIGVVSGDILINEIISIVRNSQYDDYGYSFLMDGKGKILAHPDYEYDDYSNLAMIDELSEGLLNEMKENKFGVQKVNLDGTDGFLSYQPIKNTDWTIGSFASVSEYKQNDVYLWSMLLLSLITTSFIFITFLILNNKHFLRPVNRLVKDVNYISVERDITFRLPMDKKDPLLDPRKSINAGLSMIEQLFIEKNQYEAELWAAHEELKGSYEKLSETQQVLHEKYMKVKDQREKLYHLSYHDQLTGLYNRRFFDEELERLDRKENLPLGLIMGDVNGLKLINDSFGHQTGNKFLIETARILREACGNKHIISRIGGDEFVILLSKTDANEIANLTSRMKWLSKKSKFENIALSISFGIAMKQEETESTTAIMKKAEDEMYMNKLFEGPSMRSEAIETIVQTLHEKSPRENKHSIRVAHLCQLIGLEIGMPEEKIKQLKTVALLHDIGKVAIPDVILEKPGPLNDEEWVKMKQHPAIGYRILNKTNELSVIANYVLAHHERYDGKGYPIGLKEEEIPLISRIIGIADAYDAMKSPRPYRKGLSEHIAISEIISGAGTQFDPDIARVFVEKVLNEKWIVKDTPPDKE